MKRNRLTVAVTIGDPAGIGPEVTLKAMADESVACLANWIVVGGPDVLGRTGRLLGLKLRLPLWAPESGPANFAAGGAVVLDPHSPLPKDWKMGRPTAACGRAAVACVRRAVALCRQGLTDAIVTAPLSKEAVAKTDAGFTGHTEFLAAEFGVRDVRMMLVADELRVLHATTHCSLRQACKLTAGRVRRTIELGAEALCRMGLRRRRIAVCGLNPHAGEKGLFGKEDAAEIAPAVRAARAAGIDCDGPLPADTVFWRAVRGDYDLVVAMYHDQGHIPIKLLAFERAVNVTLGLPVVRTSADHGTAFDIAGRGVADPGSMKAAMRLAVRLSGAGRAWTQARGPIGG